MSINCPVSPISLPECTAGRFTIQHKQITEADLVSGREMVLTGRKAIRLHFESPLQIHQLIEDGHGVWMSDLPIELRQIEDVLKMHEWQGYILVGGLGLGIIAAHLAAVRGNVVTVVEKEADVITLAATSAYDTICADIFDYLKELEAWKFDAAYFDTWAGTNETEWWNTVFPLRRLIGNKFGEQNVVCWAEDIMLGQVFQQLTHCTQPHWFYKAKDLPWSVPKARRFIRTIGLPKWEKEFGNLYPHET